jgi:hypothetical protein
MTPGAFLAVLPNPNTLMQVEGIYSRKGQANSYGIAYWTWKRAPRAKDTLNSIFNLPLYEKEDHAPQFLSYEELQQKVLFTFFLPGLT